MSSLVETLQTQARLASSTSGHIAEDLHAFFDIMSITAGHIDERVLAWVQTQNALINDATAAWQWMLENSDQVVAGYLILIPGAIGEPGEFDETTGVAGVIATATTDLPDLGDGFQWSIYAGSDARIGVVSTAAGQGNTMGITTSSAIYNGNTANFTVTVTNGVLTLGFPFTVTGTVSWALASALVDIDYENDRAYLYGINYNNVAHARTAGVIVNSGGLDRIALTGLASVYTFAAKGTTHSVTAVGNTARYIAALDDTTTSNLVYFGQFDDAGTAKLRHSVVTAGTDNTGGLLKTATGAGTSSAVRYAARVALNDVAVSFGGAAVQTDTSCAFPTVTQIVVADRHDATRPWLGTVKRVVVVNATTSNANLPNILA